MSIALAQRAAALVATVFLTGSDGGKDSSAVAGAELYRVSFSETGGVHAVYRPDGRLVWLDDRLCPQPDEAVVVSSRTPPDRQLSSQHFAELEAADQVEWLQIELTAKHEALVAAVRALDLCSGGGTGD